MCQKLFAQLRNRSKFGAEIIRLYSISRHKNYKITEHRIVFSKGNANSFIAGKLWEYPDSTGNKNPQVLPLICVHGFLDNAASFDTLIPLILKPGMTILAFDLLGHGLSSHTASSFYDHYMEGFISIHRVLEHYKWKKAAFIGHSLGAQMMFAFASVYPTLVDRFVALDNFRPISVNSRDYISANLSKYFNVETKLHSHEQPSYTWEEIVAKTYAGREMSINRKGCEILLRRGAKELANGRYKFTHDLRATIPTISGRFSRDQSAQFAHELQCPICVIKGEPGIDYEPREDYMAHIELVRKYSKRVEFHLIPGTHHFHLNNPEDIAPIISTFLES